jgi:hypothetical protein
MRILNKKNGKCIFTSPKDNKKTLLITGFSCLAESKRFELLIPFRGIHAFQACSLNRSDNSPVFKDGENTNLM